eukprot:scaffold299_cov343-Prasinococcus_capsulatus_cf.AAC.5
MIPTFARQCTVRAIGYRSRVKCYIGTCWTAQPSKTSCSPNITAFVAAIVMDASVIAARACLPPVASAFAVTTRGRRCPAPLPTTATHSIAQQPVSRCHSDHVTSHNFICVSSSAGGAAFSPARPSPYTVDQAVTCNPRLAFEVFRHDLHAAMVRAKYSGPGKRRAVDERE